MNLPTITAEYYHGAFDPPTFAPGPVAAGMKFLAVQPIGTLVPPSSSFGPLATFGPYGGGIQGFQTATTLVQGTIYEVLAVIPDRSPYPSPTGSLRPTNIDDRQNDPGDQVLLTDVGLVPAIILSTTRRLNDMPALMPPVFNVLLYGAAGNGTTDDTAAIASAITAASSAGAGGGCVYFPPGTYLTTAPLTLTSGVKIRGASRAGSLLTNNTTTIFNAQGVIKSIVVEHIGFLSSPSRAYQIDFTNAALSMCQFAAIRSTTINGNYSFLTASALMDSTIRDCELIGQNRLLPFLNLLGTQGALNDNLVTDCRFTDYATPQAVAIRLTEQSTTTTLGNIFANLNFENSIAGSILLQSSTNTLIDNIRVWDLGATSTASQVKITAISGSYPSSRGNKIRNYIRASSAFHNGSGFYDIELVQGGAVNTTIEGMESPGSSAGSIQSNFSVGTVIRDCENVTLSQYYGTVAAGSSAGTGATVTIPRTTTAQSPYEGVISITTGTSPSAGPIAVYTYPAGSVQTAPLAIILTPYSTNGAALVQAGPYISQASVNTFTISTAQTLAAATNYQIMFAAHRGPNT